MLHISDWFLYYISRITNVTQFSSTRISRQFNAYRGCFIQKHILTNLALSLRREKIAHRWWLPNYVLETIFYLENAQLIGECDL